MSNLLGSFSGSPKLDVLGAIVILVIIIAISCRLSELREEHRERRGLFEQEPDGRESDKEHFRI